MSLLESIVSSWPMKSNKPASSEKIISCMDNYKAEHIINNILKAHPHLNRQTIIYAMQLCCKEVIAPHYPRPFLLCVLKRLGLS